MAGSEAPKTDQWYRLKKDWPLPVSIGSLMFDQDSGELTGVGIYLRLPMPWDEYLEPWPEAK